MQKVSEWVNNEGHHSFNDNVSCAYFMIKIIEVISSCFHFFKSSGARI